MKKLLLLSSLLFVSLIGYNQCPLNADFTYSISGGTISFTNTSTDEPLSVSYYWTVGAETSYLENPSFAMSDLGGSFTACLYVSGTDDSTALDSTAWCDDYYCEYIIDSSWVDPGDSTWVDPGDSTSGGGLDDSTTAAIYGMDMSDEPTVTIFPNPMTDFVTISAANGNEFDAVYLFDLTGRMVYSRRGSLSALLTIDIQDLPSGSYVLKVENSIQPELSLNRHLIKH